MSLRHPLIPVFSDPEDTQEDMLCRLLEAARVPYVAGMNFAMSDYVAANCPTTVVVSFNGTTLVTLTYTYDDSFNITNIACS